MSTQMTTKLNGLDTTQMIQTVAAIKGDPGLAQFQFRARNQWIDGGENRSTVKDFHAAGREDDSRQEPFVWTDGEPPILLGNNEGGNPVEFLLHALAGCVTTTFVLHAAARGIRIKMNVEADCSEEELEDLFEFTKGHSPVCTTVCRPVPVVITRA